LKKPARQQGIALDVDVISLEFEEKKKIEKGIKPTLLLFQDFIRTPVFTFRVFFLFPDVKLQVFC
jgi:hypothetical protein